MLHKDPTSELYHTDYTTLIGVPGLILMPTGLNFAMSVVISISGIRKPKWFYSDFKITIHHRFSAFGLRSCVVSK